MRGSKAKKRLVESDPIYKSKTVSRFINYLMQDGKKSKAREIVYSVLESLSKDQKESVTFFEDAIKNVMPKQEVRSRRVGGATYQVPVLLKHDRSEALALRWLIDTSRSKKGDGMANKLLSEMKAALNNEGTAIKKRQDVERMADANKAFSHFKW